MAVNGMDGAKYLLTRIGNSYSDEDCVHAVVINLIRNCRGGDRSYRTAGCTELWNSYDKLGKYRHITRRMTLEEAKQEGLMIGDLPVIYDEKTGKCEHIAYYMGGIGGYECIHSSASKGCVCGTTLKNGFTHVLRHRDITGVYENASRDNSVSDGTQKGDCMDVLYFARVATEGGALNLRSAAQKGKNVICEIPFGTEVGVLEETSAEWTKVQYENIIGYVAKQYLAYSRTENEAEVIEEEIDNEPTVKQDTTLFGGTWGVFIPCRNKSTANTLAAYFKQSDVIKVSLGD